MRRLILGLAVLMGACASGATTPAPAQSAADNPFLASRGTAPPPPAAAPSDPAPPQGVGAGGFDFGAWRTMEAGAYAQSFTRAMSARLAGMDRAAARADLERNGFRCEEGARLQCVIETMENGCARDWYVALEGASPHAGYDAQCAGTAGR